MPVLCRIPVDPGCFLGAGIVIPAHFGVWDRDPGWVPGQRHLCAGALYARASPSAGGWPRPQDRSADGDNGRPPSDPWGLSID